MFMSENSIQSLLAVRLHIRKLVVFPLVLLSVGAAWAQQCPPNARPDIFGKGCVCNTGYVVENGYCVEMKIPDNAHPNYLGGWDCDRGFKKAGNECIAVQLPPNASFTYGGGWVCNQGYERRGNTCERVILPDNAHFTFGSMWECNPGFKKQGGQCVDMNRHELIEQNKRLSEMLYMQMSKSTGGDCSAGFDACEDECDDQFSSYSNEDKCEEVCEEGKDACD